jgi:CheY-like chemotaxis protein
MDDSNYALVTDPDEARAQVYASILRERALTPVIADDGEEAVGVIEQRGAPALAIVELALPRLDGFAVIGRLRKQAPPSRSKVVAISGFRALRDAATGLRASLGIGAILAKAAGDESVRRVVRTLLSPLSEVPPEPAPEPDPAPREARRAESMRAAGLTPPPLVDGPDDEVQKIVDAVATEFSAPIVVVTLAHEDKLHFVARVGIDAYETERYSTLCNQVIEAASPLAVADTRTHPVYASNGLVRAGVIRGYASAPVVSASGEVWGTLCIIDSKRPLPIGKAELLRLCSRARRVAIELECSSGRASRAPTS